jgi:hypothetical protein
MLKEGCFLISPNKANSFTFRFRIKLHIDDLDVLNYMKNILGIGKVITSQRKPEASFEVNIQQEIMIIIANFSRCNLNTLKHLNFLDFKQAFLLYMEHNNREARDKIVIDNIRRGMNLRRIDFSLPEDHVIRITPY